MIDMGALEDEIDKQFDDDETDLQVEIPDALPGYM